MCGHHKVIKCLSVTALTKLRNSEIQSKGFVTKNITFDGSQFQRSSAALVVRAFSAFLSASCSIFHATFKVWTEVLCSKLGLRKTHCQRQDLCDENKFISCQISLYMFCMLATSSINTCRRSWWKPSILSSVGFKISPNIARCFWCFLNAVFFPPITPRQFRSLNVMSSESAISCFKYLFNIFTYLHIVHILKKFKRRS